MKARIIIAVAFLISVTILFAQTEEHYPFKLPMNNIYLEVLVGDGTFKTSYADETAFSLNYERLFYIRPKIFITAGLGAGCTSVQDVWYPIGISVGIVF
jgi:hypothetical protein